LLGKACFQEVVRAARIAEASDRGKPMTDLRHLVVKTNFCTVLLQSKRSMNRALAPGAGC